MQPLCRAFGGRAFGCDGIRDALGGEPLDEELGDEAGTRAVAGLAGDGIEEEDVDLGRDWDRNVALPVDRGDSVCGTAYFGHGMNLLGG